MTKQRQQKEDSATTCFNQELEETKRIMERLVKTPPKPHKHQEANRDFQEDIRDALNPKKNPPKQNKKGTG